MSDNLHKLAIQIQGDIDNRFGDAIKDMSGHLKQLEEGVKNISESKAKPDSISKEFIRMNSEAGQTAQELEKLNRQMRQVDGYAAQRAATTEAAKKYRDAQAELRRLKEAQAQSGTKEFAADIKKAQKAANDAEKTYNKERKTLTGMGAKLKEAGIGAKNLGAEQKRLAGEIVGATKRSEELNRSIQKITRAKYHFNALRGQVKQLGSDFLWVGKTYLKMGALLGAGGAALYKISDSVASAGDIAAKSAAKLNMTAEAFQEMQYAAKLSGVKDFEAMTRRFNASVAKAANGTGEAAKELKAMNINAKQLYKMGPEKAMMVLSDELNKIKDPAQRARAELALFGEGGAEMGAFLRIGSKGIRELRDEAKQTGLVISSETAKQAEAFNDARDKMSGAISGLKNILGAELLPVFTQTFHELSDFFVNNQGVIREFAGNLGKGFRDALPKIKEFMSGAGKMVGVLWEAAKVVTNLVGGVDNLAKIVVALPLAKPLFTIGKMIYSLGGLIGSLSGVAGAIGLIGKALILNPIGLTIMAIAGAAYVVYKNWEPIKGFFVDIWNTLSERASAFKEVVLGIPAAIGEIFADVKDYIIAPFEGAFTWVSNKWASLKGMFSKGPRVDVDYGEVHGRASRARGGMSSVPIVTSFAERGPEVAVPVGLADRSFGISNLNLASRAMGFGNVVPGTRTDEHMPQMPNLRAQTKQVSLKIDYAPTVQLTVNGGNANEIRQVVIDALREFGAKMLPEWQEQLARVAYVTG